MNKDKLLFIEETGLIFEQMGMTRMAGRVFGYLTVCDQDAVSFDQIKTILDASKGSISGTTKQLIEIGFIEPVSLPGDRKTYFRVTKLELGNIIKSRMKMFSKFAGVLLKGRNLKEREDEVSDWLLESSTFYNWIGGEIDQIINKWHQEKDQIMNKI